MLQRRGALDLFSLPHWLPAPLQTAKALRSAGSAAEETTVPCAQGSAVTREHRNTRTVLLIATFQLP